MHSYYEKVGHFPKRLNIELPYGPSTPPLLVHECPALVTITRKWKQPNAHRGWLDRKRYYSRIVEYYLVMKRNKTPIYSKRQMNLENIMLNEKRQPRRPHIILSHLYEVPQIGKSIESLLVAARDCGGEGSNGEWQLNCWLLFGVIKMFWN